VVTFINIRKRRKHDRLKALSHQKGFKVAICGAGIAGICMGVKLKQLGIPFTIYEKNKDLGGTWLENVYPGSGCDIPSHFYSYSFFLNPNWSRIWPKRDEIIAYLESAVDAFHLRSHIKFNTSITDSVWDGKHWIMTCRNESTQHESTRTCNVFISAVGQLNVPSIPSGISGAELFKGDIFHTARWKTGVDLNDKCVLGVGTGPSAIQAFPEIAKNAKKLTVVQRSPVYVLEKPDRVYWEFEKFLNRICPPLLWLRRINVGLMPDLVFPILFQKDSSDAN